MERDAQATTRTEPLLISIWKSAFPYRRLSVLLTAFFTGPFPRPLFRGLVPRPLSLFLSPVPLHRFSLRVSVTLRHAVKLNEGMREPDRRVNSIAGRERQRGETKGSETV